MGKDAEGRKVLLIAKFSTPHLTSEIERVAIFRLEPEGFL